MKNICLKVAAALALCVSLASCSEDEDMTLLTFHSATSRGIISDLSRTSITLPVSGVETIYENEQFMYSGDISQVDLAQVKLPDGSPLTVFMFTCNDRGKRRLYTTTASNMGGSIVVLYGGKPLAFRKIDVVISDGILLAVPELPEGTDLFKELEKIRESVKNVNEYKKDL